MCAPLAGPSTTTTTTSTSTTTTTLRFADNGDGTVTDHQTCLQWEKKDNLDGSVNLLDPHDADNIYTWSSTGTAADGTAFTDLLSRLNSSCVSTTAGSTVTGGFAGHCDWRVPNLKELESIVNLENSAPAVSPAFDNNCTSPCTVLTCSCTQSSAYWSSSNNAVFPQDAWAVSFQDGSVPASVSKVNSFVARAVRGGS